MDENVEFVDCLVDGELTAEVFKDLIQMMRAALGVTAVLGRPVLPVHTQGYNRWFDIRLHMENGKRVTLRFHRENLYLQGFRVNDGNWYELGDRLLISDSSVLLNIGHNYNGMLNSAGYETLNQVQVGLVSLINAGNTLSRAGEGESTKNIARALLCLVIMFCETTRFTRILNFIRTNFLNEQPALLQDWITVMVRQWSTYSSIALECAENPDLWQPMEVPYDAANPDGTGIRYREVQTLSSFMLFLGILLRQTRSSLLALIGNDFILTPEEAQGRSPAVTVVRGEIQEFDLENLLE